MTIIPAEPACFGIRYGKLKRCPDCKHRHKCKAEYAKELSQGWRR